MRVKLAPWLDRKEAERKAEIARQKAEAEAAAKAAEEAAAKARESEDAIGAAVEAEQAQKRAEELAKQADRTQRAKVGVKPSIGGGRAKTFRHREVDRITNKNIIPSREIGTESGRVRGGQKV